ncbi:hypothetical protein ACUXK4_004871 [Methylorubrum extorquens]
MFSLAAILYCLGVGQGNATTFNCPAIARNGKEAAERLTCLRNRATERVGKYFCFVEQMAGIQFPTKDGEEDYNSSPFVGKIAPLSDKFIIEISVNSSHDLCANKENMDQYCNGEPAALLLLKSDSSVTLGYGKSSDGYFFDSMSGKFSLYGNMTFTSYRSLGNTYIARGKCEKIN